MSAEISQAECMRKLRRFWKRNPRSTPQMVKIWDKYFLRLSRFNKEILIKELVSKEYAEGKRK